MRFITADNGTLINLAHIETIAVENPVTYSSNLTHPWVVMARTASGEWQKAYPLFRAVDKETAEQWLADLTPGLTASLPF